MSVGQMLWHVDEAMEAALGRIQADPMRVPLPRSLLKLLMLNAPWGKGTPTVKRWIPQRESYDFAAERERCDRLNRGNHSEADRAMRGPTVQHLAV